MSTPLLVTKLYVPPPRHEVVSRPRLIARLNAGQHRQLTLVSAPAGFGKTTLVSEWIAGAKTPTAWVSLDDSDSDLGQFLTYLISALQTVVEDIGAGLLATLQAPQPPPAEPILTTVLNEIAKHPGSIVLVLDDYHVIDSPPVDEALKFLVEHLPPNLHLVITTREGPQLPLARLRARAQLTELRATELRFTASEAAEFLNQAMGLALSEADIIALEERTEGWIAGLQLAAISIQGQHDTSDFIASFTGSHRFVMDYLVEEVLNQQPFHVQQFLLQTSILDQLCGPLCDAVVLESNGSGQALLEYIERANLFLIPLDNHRQWYRYHHLFAGLLRQRLGTLSDDLHGRASGWFEANGFQREAFTHATAGNDVARAERLIEGHGTPLQFRGTGAPVLNWLESLPTATLDARPSLWVTYASTLMFNGRHTDVEATLRSAESALTGGEPNRKTSDLMGRIASLRATLGIVYDDLESIFSQSRRALEFLDPDNVLARIATTYTLGYAHQLQGDRAEATRAFTDVIARGAATGDSIYNIAATIGLAQVQQADIDLVQAAKSSERVVKLAGDPPQPIACVAFLELAQIHYQWNDLDVAERYARQGDDLTKQMASLTTFATHAMILANLDLARNNLPAAAARLEDAEVFVRQHNFLFQMPELAAAQVVCLLRQEKLDRAAQLAQSYDLPLSQARVHLARGDSASALSLLEPFRARAETREWRDDRLKAMLLLSLAHQASGDHDLALQTLGGTLALAKPGGFIRIFVDEGPPMFHLLSTLASQRNAPTYAGALLDAFGTGLAHDVHAPRSSAPSLADPLSLRELEVLRLIALGLSNHEIGERLFLALNTVKGHNRVIFGKLGVQRRTEAVARGRDLDLL